MAGAVLALDIGGTKLAVGVISPAGEVLAEEVAATDPRWSPTEVLEVLFARSEQALARAGGKWGALRALGVSFGGPVDFPAGRTVACHHLPGWEEVPLRQLVADRARRPVLMDNDANAAALGEATFGAARGCQHVLYLTVSTGIGAGLVLNGKLHRGANSMAGELGHTLVAPYGPRCSCGRLGCLEAVGSGPAIARTAREALQAGGRSAMQAIPGSQLTAEHVSEYAQTDALAARIIRQAGKYLGVAIAAAVNLVNPEVVVIGGGVSQAGEILLGSVREAVARHAVPESGRELRILPAQLGPRAALLGAAALALSEAALAERTR